MFRPVRSEWMEILIERSAVDEVLNALAESGVIELQRELTTAIPFEVESNESARARLASVRSAYAGYRHVLPVPDRSDVPADAINLPTEQAVTAVTEGLARWKERVDPTAARLRALDTEREELELLDACLVALPTATVDLAYFRSHGAAPGRYTPWLAMGEALDPEFLVTLPHSVLLESFPLPGKDPRVVLVGVTETGSLAELERRMHAQRVRFARVPEWIRGDAPAARRLIAQRAEEIGREREDLGAKLAESNRDHHVAGYLWLAERHRWLLETLDYSWCGRNFVLLTGWVPVNLRGRLEDCLRASGEPYLVHADTEGDHGEGPVMLYNPRWMRRFELFVRAFGLPAANEVDPSPLLALAMPLMFGYMFGDVGQGLILLIVGLLLRERYPVMGLFVPAGVAGIVFGFLFGSIFCFEHVIHPLWINPMEDPILILAVPLLFGAGFMLIGLGLASVQAHWAGQAAHWWQMELPVILIYLGVLLLLPAAGAGQVVLSTGLVWLMVAAGWRGARRAGAKGLLVEPFAVLAPLIEDLFQLLINTLSFVRVGAFALAHVGLSLAVVALSEIPESMLGRIMILVFGNLLVVGLEGLVVSIQTTRLVLFEFFRRFLQAGGRPFRPLMPPETAAPTGG